MASWNLWHGCTKISAGCQNCYVYRRDSEFGKDSSLLEKTSSFDLPLRRKRDGSYLLQDDGDFVYTCFTSDFFHPAADAWRTDAWRMIRERKDLNFFIVTKRPERFYESLPDDWGDGCGNVYICCTCENQKTADERLPVYLELPIKHKSIIHEPMLEGINIERYLSVYGKEIESVSCGGESGAGARLCDFDWILWTRDQCVRYGVSFRFRQTGANFKKDGRIYSIPRNMQLRQAERAGINYTPSALFENE
ncbi:MAG: DUF5131 family protein [Clostridia bacterium]|nr:DUF5131 family protein [Clostridia bacterium]